MEPRPRGAIWTARRPGQPVQMGRRVHAHAPWRSEIPDCTGSPCRGDSRRWPGQPPQAPPGACRTNGSPQLKPWPGCASHESFEVLHVGQGAQAGDMGLLQKARGAVEDAALAPRSDGSGRIPHPFRYAAASMSLIGTARVSLKARPAWRSIVLSLQARLDCPKHTWDWRSLGSRRERPNRLDRLYAGILRTAVPPPEASGRFPPRSDAFGHQKLVIYAYSPPSSFSPIAPSSAVGASWKVRAQSQGLPAC